MNNNSHLADRKYIVSGFFIVVAMVYICRLFYIQIVDEQYKLDARNNAFRNRTEYPLRGYIYDRNGKLLVQNVLSYDLLVTPKLVKDCDTMAICKVLEITKEEFLKKMKKACQAPNSPRKESISENNSPIKYMLLFKKNYIDSKALMFNQEPLENILDLLQHIY